MKNGIAILIALLVACRDQGSQGKPTMSSDADSTGATRHETSGCSEGWLRYEPVVEEASGTLRVSSWFGPPTFGEQPDIDERLRVPLLILDHVLSVCADSTSDVNSESVIGLDTLQLTTLRDAADSDSGVRLAVACNRSTPREVLELLRNDPSDEVARKAADRLSPSDV